MTKKMFSTLKVEEMQSSKFGDKKQIMANTRNGSEKRTKSSNNNQFSSVMSIQQVKLTNKSKKINNDDQESDFPKMLSKKTSLKLNNQLENSEIDDSSKIKDKKDKTLKAEDLLNF